MQPSVIHLPKNKRLKYHRAVFDLRKWNYNFIRIEYAHLARKHVVVVSEINDIPVHIECEYEVDPDAPDVKVEDVALELSLCWMLDVPPNIADEMSNPSED
jgi:hypothetical protein